MKNIKFGLLTTVFIFIFLVVLSYIFTSTLDKEFISKWGIGIGILMIISILPLHRFLFFGSLPSAPNWVPTDESKIYRRIIKDYEDEKGKVEHPYRWVLVISGMLIILISIIMTRI
ncbi:hypothetical protein [Ammoniphilus sp. 3BR4]|uniref:hypothetical protein n=1 Tax=Ammoniphilus sp. 3BR4 TaxID=3158265 RepID=UPI0034651D57